MAKEQTNQPDFFSITTIGERGQLVIPKEARDALELKAGDKLFVMPSRRGDGILLMKEQNIKEIAVMMSEKAELFNKKSITLQQKLQEAEQSKPN